ncbi:MAG: iron-sulfur cluster assembly scaffold protein [Bryobacterales bacterium]|nr:iron-sulfur cluster assembly scaffold protein [Bryobacterales bacterium]
MLSCALRYSRGVYSEQLLDHFQNPRNVGELEEADLRVEVSNPICGDILRLTATLAGGRISEVAYRTRGCTASIAVASALTELLVGTSAPEALAIDRDVIEAAVGGLSNESKHAAVLAVDGVRALVVEWRARGAA